MAPVPFTVRTLRGERYLPRSLLGVAWRQHLPQTMMLP